MSKEDLIAVKSSTFMEPQILLSASFSRRNLSEFRIALDRGANPTLLDEKDTNIYEKVLSTHGCCEFLQECLKRDCSPHYMNVGLNKSAINFAVDSRDPKTLSVLLHYRDVQVDHRYSHLTPLNSLAKNVNPDNVEDVSTSIKLLLDYGASPNIPDQREMTPLHYVLKDNKLNKLKRYQIIQMIVNLCPDLDIDSYRNGEVREILKKEYPELNTERLRAPSCSVNIDLLLVYLRSGDEDKFLEEFPKYQEIMTAKNLASFMQEQSLLLFLESIIRGRHQAFDSIMLTGLNVNSLHNGRSPIGTAVLWGNWLALRKLLNQQQVYICAQEQLLITVIKKLDDPALTDFCDYNKCFFILLESGRVDVNDADLSGSTPLHFAVKYRNRNATKELLKQGAYIGAKSAFGDLPIDGIHADVLEEHLDNCITTNALKVGDERFELLLNYMNVLPPLASSHSNTTRRHQEMAPIAFMSQSKELHHLLQHPLITSFLLLKWHRLSTIFYINLLLYLLFATSIVAHTLLKFRESENVAFTTFFGVTSWIGIVYLIIREVMQLVLSPGKYFRSPTNYAEIALIALSIATCIEPKYDRETHRVLAVLTILLVAFELCMLVGSLPVLSISTHMLMLRAVSTSFIKSFTFYSILVITFSLCFYILFGKPEAMTSEDNGEFNKFSNPFTAAIKTVVMLTGEFDAGDIDFNTLYSYLVFLLFVFFMSIVLFNLLNGLAVSDTQTIKAQAELNGYICRTNLLTRYERVFTGHSGPARFLIQHETFRNVFDRPLTLYPHHIADRQISILPNDHNKIILPMASSYEQGLTENISCARSKNISDVYLMSLSDDDHQRRETAKPGAWSLCIGGRSSEMDSQTVKTAIAVIERRNNTKDEHTRLQHTERRLQKIEDKLEEIYSLVTEMQKRKA